jgi:hypothetical protein
MYNVTMWENYGRLGEDEDFSIAFWQSQPPEVIFEAAADLIKDYLLLREGYAGELRLQRTVESFQTTNTHGAEAAVDLPCGHK